MDNLQIIIYLALAGSVWLNYIAVKCLLGAAREKEQRDKQIFDLKYHISIYDQCSTEQVNIKVDDMMEKYIGLK